MKPLQFATFVSLLGVTAPGVFAQTTHFSIDWHGPTVGVPGSGGGGPITAGDMLSPAAGMAALGPLAVPVISVPHGVAGSKLMAGCVGVPGGVPCVVEVDAFSYGRDAIMQPAGIRPGQLHFSVDEFAVGLGPLAPNVATESPVADAPADVMLNARLMPGGPLPPGPSVGHRGIFDGDGLFSGSGFTYPGLGTIEPSPPMAGPASAGDNLDALDTVPPGPTVIGPHYFSLDAGFVDPLTGIANSGSAAAHGFMGADVLVAAPFAIAPAIYAPAGLLGLNGFPGQDDLDALILAENGDGVYQPSMAPYDWMGGGTDMLLFSVRRGSAVIGMPDSIFGIPIEEGDILTTPLPTFLGGVSPFPGIFVAAENFGLATTRSVGAFPGDDLTALDSIDFLIKDCDTDGVEDVVAIAVGAVTDLNMNGIPDSCEISFTCTPLVNSTGFPTALTGSAMVGGSGLHLEGTSGPPTQFGYFLVGSGLQSPGLMVGSGRLCLATAAPNVIGRYNISGTVMNSVGQFDAAGVIQNLVGTATSSGGSGFDVPTALPSFGGTIMPGQTWHFQLWHRDIPGTSNFSNAISWTF